MRLELQFSFCFLTDYLAAKVIGQLASKLDVGTTFPIGSLVNYVPKAAPTITNQSPGVIQVQVVLNPLMPVLKINLGASTSNGLSVTATLANSAEIATFLTNVGATVDPSLLSTPIKAPLPLDSIVGAGQPAATQAGFAANAAAQVVALRIEFGSAAPLDAALWIDFLQNHAFAPIFQPNDITVDPPREWAARIDWQLVKPMFASKLEPLVKTQVTALASDASVTGPFSYAWGLAKGNQAAGFSDSWPFENGGAWDLDATCPVHAKGHDGHVYLQLGLSSGGRDSLHIHAEIKAHVYCCWQDAAPVDLDTTLGGFGFDSNSLQVDGIATDARGLVVRGEAVLFMPLAFPIPSVDVGNFTWMFQDACNGGSLAQLVGVYLTDASPAGRRTPLRGRLKVTAPFPVAVDAIPTLDAKGIGVAPVAWTLAVAAADVPAAGGNVTISVETNAGTPSFPSGPTVAVPLAPPLTDKEKFDMQLKAVAVCESSRHAGYVKKFIPEPPEEIIWWLTQEVVAIPAVTRNGTPVAIGGPITRVAVGKAALVAALRQYREHPQGNIVRQTLGRDGIRSVVSRLLVPAAAATRVGMPEHTTKASEPE